MALAMSASGASLFTETFTGSTGGWQDRDSGGMTVTNVLTGGNPGGALRGQFEPQFGPPIPEVDAIIATGRFASANFIGNYKDIDAWVLGFDVLAENVLPSSFRLNLYSGTDVIGWPLDGAIAATGVWHSFTLPLLGPEQGAWEGATSLFHNILTNVTRIEFRIARNGEVQQSYFLDNIFIDRLPDAASIDPVDMIWLHMRMGATYRFEATTNLTSSTWTVLETFQADSPVYVPSLPGDAPWRYFRMILE